MTTKKLVTFKTASLSQISTATADHHAKKPPSEMSDETLGILMDRLLQTAAYTENSPLPSKFDLFVAKRSRENAARYRAELVARGYEIPDPEVETC